MSIPSSIVDKTSKSDVLIMECHNIQSIDFINLCQKASITENQTKCCIAAALI